MITHEQKDISHFVVSDILETVGYYYFIVTAFYTDDTRQRLSIVRIGRHRSLELFRFHHSECKRIYESLD